MFGLSFGELMVISAVGVIFFGAKRLPELGSAMGKAITNFKKGLQEGLSEGEATGQTGPHHEDRPSVEMGKEGEKKSIGP